jgi:hypothetical protein
MGRWLPWKFSSAYGSQVGAVSGNMVVWVFRLTFPSAGSGVFTLNLTPQGDGSFQGTLIVNINGVSSAPHAITMTRN